MLVKYPWNGADLGVATELAGLRGPWIRRPSMAWQPWVVAHDLFTYRLRNETAHVRGCADVFSTLRDALLGLHRLVELVGAEAVIDAGVWAVNDSTAGTGLSPANQQCSRHGDGCSGRG